MIPGITLTFNAISYEAQKILTKNILTKKILTKKSRIENYYYYRATMWAREQNVLDLPSNTNP